MSVCIINMPYILIVFNGWFFFVVLMPHLGSATVKTRIGMVDLAAKNVLAAFEGKPLLTPIN